VKFVDKGCFFDETTGKIDGKFNIFGVDAHEVEKEINEEFFENCRVSESPVGDQRLYVAQT